MSVSKRVWIKNWGDPINFQDATLTQVKAETYCIAYPHMDLWKRGSPIEVALFNNGVVELVKPHWVDPLFGIVELHKDRVFSKAQISGTYVPHYIVAQALSYRLVQDQIRNKHGTRVPYTMLRIDNLSSMEEEFFETVYGYRPVLIEIEASKGKKMRGWFEISVAESHFKVPISLVFKPHWVDGISYGWSKKKKSR